jgi:hypothetical protein
MDELYRTPLLDCFRRGEVAPDVRMLAAQGVLAPRAHEQLGLLVLLSTDADPAIRAAAEATIGRIPPGALSRFLGRSDVPDDIRTFFERRGIQAAPAAPGPSDAPLVESAAGDAEPATEPDEGHPPNPDGEPRASTVQRLSRMNVTERMKAAMRGSREERTILIRDSNKLVSIAVLSSPKVSEQEVESYAKMASVSEDVLRVIGTSRSWVKNYSVIKSLTYNPKTPVALSMGFVNRLVEKDVKGLTTDRNIPEPVKLLARKIIQAGQSRKH